MLTKRVLAKRCCSRLGMTRTQLENERAKSRHPFNPPATPPRRPADRPIPSTPRSDRSSTLAKMMPMEDPNSSISLHTLPKLVTEPTDLDSVNAFHIGTPYPHRPWGHNPGYGWRPIYWYEDWSCDSQPSDRDWWWWINLYAFPGIESVSWYFNTYWWVDAGLRSAYPGGIGTWFNLGHGEVWPCMGDAAWFLGLEYVAASLHITY